MAGLIPRFFEWLRPRPLPPKPRPVAPPPAPPDPRFDAWVDKVFVPPHPPRLSLSVPSPPEPGEPAPPSAQVRERFVPGGRSLNGRLVLANCPRLRAIGD